METIPENFGVLKKRVEELAQSLFAPLKIHTSFEASPGATGVSVGFTLTGARTIAALTYAKMDMGVRDVELIANEIMKRLEKKLIQEGIDNLMRPTNENF